MMTDPIADMLTRIRNSSAAGKAEVVLPLSKMKYSIAKILEKENFIQKCEIIEDGASQAAKEIKIVLKYKKSGRPVISSLKRISKPGLRIYIGKNNIKPILNGFGFSIISTPQGLMTNREARKNGLGGEVICEIY